ncbi:putative pentatricopeptide repeat-containing protein At5g08310, mitochondrial [Primulina huaijiensis]|uniref:putative pentatricopeptide repeat-containing protein At5g08310, mitochondrial n=1 Tax=Primulina huaijiensis TaxID=1492673 RepID=UPI003CC751B3
MALYKWRIPKKTRSIALLLKPARDNSINSNVSTNDSCFNCVKKRAFCSNANIGTAETLVFIFTTRPFSLESPQLQELSSKLTTEIVEIVLKSLRNWRLAELFFNWASNQQGYLHSCYTYNAMAAILADARQNAPLRALAVDISNSPCFWTPGALGYFLRCLGGRSMVKEANFLFDQMKSSGLCVHNCYSYNCLLEVISKIGDVSLMEYRLNEMKILELSIDKHTLTPVLQCYCNAGKFEKALMIFNEMNEKGWTDQHILNILVLSYSKSGKVDAAFELIEWMERNLKFSLNQEAFCVLIHGFSRESRLDKALQLYYKMKKLGYMPDIAIYDVLIGGLCKNREIEKALILYTHMQQLGILPDVRIISKLLSSVPNVRVMIRLLKDRWKALAEEEKNSLYYSVLTGFVHDGFVDKAYDLLKVSMAAGVDRDIQADKIFLVEENLVTSCFQTVIDGLCKSDKLDMALDLFYDMDPSGCKHDLLHFNNLIQCLSNGDRLDECFDILNMMRKSEFQPNHFTFNAIFGCLCRRGDFAGALDMFKEMRASGHQPWIKYYTLLVKKLCEQGKAVEARNFLADMREEGFLPDIIAYSAVINGFININELNQSLELFEEICEIGYSPDVVVYNIVIKGLCKAYRINEAEEIFSKMLGKGLVPSVVTHNLLIDVWCKAGDTDRGMLCFSRMKEKKQEPNVITYTTLVDGLCNARKPDDALKLWIDMEHNGCDPNKIAYMALIHGLCKCKEPDAAVVYLQKMEEKGIFPDAYIYEDLIVAYESKSNTAMAHLISEKKAKHGISS